MYIVTDNRKKENMITFNDVEIGEFFYGQIFDCSFNESEEHLCLKVDDENYFCFTDYYNCLFCYSECSVAITEIFDEKNKNKIRISIE